MGHFCPSSDYEPGQRPTFDEVVAHAREGCALCEWSLRGFIAKSLKDAPRHTLFAICDVISEEMRRERQREEN